MKHFIYPIGVFLSISVLLNSCAKEEEAEVNLAELQLSKVLAIESNEENIGSAPILPFVADVAVNSEGYIFIFTGQDSKFHIYDQDGNWVNSFGRSGAGPGELGQISTIYIDSRDRLIVADRGNGRISIFDNNGALITTSSSGGINTIRSVREMPDGRFIVAGQRGDYLIHVFDSEFHSIQSSFSTVEEFANNDRESEIQWIKGQAGQVYPWSERQIAFVPANYQGVVYLYEEKSVNDWHMIEKINGYKLFDPALSFYSDQPPSGTPVHGIVGSPAGMMYISYRTLSYGFYQTQEGSLYHISYQTAEEGMNLVIEHFDTASNKLIEYGMVYDLDIEHSLRKQPLWMDHSLNLYLTDNSEIPGLQVLNLEFN
jgi:hypothetical protein